MNKVKNYLFFNLIACLFILTSCQSEIEKADELRIAGNYEESTKLYMGLAKKNNAYAMWRLALAYQSGDGIEFSSQNALKWLKEAYDAGCEEAKMDMAEFYMIGYKDIKVDKSKGKKIISELENSSQNSYVLSRIAGFYYYGNDDIEKDQEKARQIIEKVPDKESPYYLYLMGFLYRDGTDEIEPDVNKAKTCWIKAFQKGAREASKQIAFLYLTGDLETEKDYDEYVKWLKMGAEKNSCSSMSQLAGVYTSEDTIFKAYHKPNEGIALLRKAIKNGSGEACDYMGYLYATGNVVDKDDNKAFEYFKKADEYEFSNGSLNLAVNYLTGRGCQKDVIMAEKYMVKAADKGSSDASCRLYYLYTDGTFKKDTDKAKSYLEKASKKGSAKANYELASLYYLGKMGYPQDNFQSFIFMKKAADGGFPDAINALAYMYENGLGCEKDPLKAKEYRNKLK